MVVPGRAWRCSAASDQRTAVRDDRRQPVHMDDVVDLRLGRRRHGQPTTSAGSWSSSNAGASSAPRPSPTSSIVGEGIDLGQRSRRLAHVELAGHDIGDEARAVFAEEVRFGFFVAFLARSHQ